MSDAPRITPEAIEANIVSEHYFTAHQGARVGFLDDAVEEHINPFGVLTIPDELRLLTICVLVLRNGFTVVGTSACASPENFNRKIGETIAREKAIEQIWPLMGYTLRTHLYEQASAQAKGAAGDRQAEGHDAVGTGEAEATLETFLTDQEKKA